MPGALWHPIPSFTPGNVTRPPSGMVVHTAVTPETLGALDGLLNYIANPANQSSPYFCVGIDGTIVQCIDLNDEAWTQRSGNHNWIGVENVGDGTHEGLTQAQMEANAKIFAWLHATYPNIPLQLTHNPAVPGLGYHGMGAPGWGHAVCPGFYIIGQLPTILAYAVALDGGIPPASPPGGHMSRMVAHDESNTACITLNGDEHTGGTALVAMGCHPWDVDGKKVIAIDGGQIFHFDAHEHCVEIIPNGKDHKHIICRMRADSGGGDTFPTVPIPHGHVY